MKKTIDFYDFKQGFVDADRDYFTDDGYSALFDYIEDYEEESGEEIEFDPIAIVCDCTEYDNLKALENDFGYLYSREDYMKDYDVDEVSDEDYFDELINEIEYHTNVIIVGDFDCIVGAF